MLLKIADNYDEEVDNAVSAMTSLLEPVMIVFLAVVVGSIVIAMFLPLISLMSNLGNAEGEGGGEKGAQGVRPVNSDSARIWPTHPWAANPG